MKNIIVKYAFKAFTDVAPMQQQPPHGLHGIAVE
jgi:hypothetical protein